MADIQITPEGEDNRAADQGTMITVWVTTLVGYVFYKNHDGGASMSLWYVKTTDGGQTWGGATQVNSEAAAANRAVAYSVWFDQWTPGDAGTLIHIVWSDDSAGTATFKYNQLDTADDSLGTQTNVATGLTKGFAATVVCITKARGGNLYALRRFNAGNNFYRSVNAGAAWAARTAPTAQNPTRMPWLTPGNEADNQDIYGVWIGTAITFILQAYDDSANSWTNTTMFTTANSFDTLTHSSSIRKSDNHTIAVVVENDGAGGKNLHVFDISDGTTFTQKTDVFTGEANHVAGRTNVLIDDDDNIYVAYRGIQGGAGGAAAYKESTDGGDTWGSDTRLDEAGLVTTYAGLALTPGDAGGRLYGMWALGTNVLSGNYGSSVALGAVAAGFQGLAQAMLVTRGI